MAARVLSKFDSAEVRSENTTESCYVTLGRSVYDITEFLDSHPGGSDLVLEYGGKDVTKAMKDDSSHVHTDSAYEILEDYRIGFTSTNHPTDDSVPGKALATVFETEFVLDPAYASTGMSREEDLSIDTDYNLDFKTHRFLDLRKPLLIQLWQGNFSKSFYLDQVHRPRHYRGGESAPLFGNFLEPLSKSAWYLVPSIWLPLVAYGTMVGFTGLGNSMTASLYWIGGFCLWTLIEYSMHRYLYHIDHWLPDNRVSLMLHFLLHGIHHYLPMDKYRLVTPPALFVFLATPFWKLSHAVFFYNWFAAVTVFCGGVFGYICYDMTHYFIHHHK